MSRRCPIRAAVCTILVMGAFALGGCGQRGPLYLPPAKAKHAPAPATAPQTTPAPAANTR
ncbi:MAG: LPS translocon maturation chaperone LptM [Gammaproteobacteria bacterium]